MKLQKAVHIIASKPFCRNPFHGFLLPTPISAIEKYLKNLDFLYILDKILEKAFFFENFVCQILTVFVYFGLYVGF